MPFMTNGRRNYKKEAEWDAHHKTRTQDRRDRVKARREAISAGRVHRNDGKQIDHIKPLALGGSNDASNTRVTSAHANESFRRNAKGGIVSQTSKSEARSAHKRKGR